MLNFKSEIEMVRERFLTVGRSKLDDFTDIPIWVKADPLAQVYIDAPRLFKEGKIVYASLLQANENLFFLKPKLTLPGLILFSMDSYYDENPLELRDLAIKLFQYKGRDDAPIAIKNIVDAITNELSRPMNIVLPHSLTQDRTVYFTSMMFHRSHLPFKYISTNIFPVLALPTMLKSTVLLPGHYWTIPLQLGYKNV